MATKPTKKMDKETKEKRAAKRKPTVYLDPQRKFKAGNPGRPKGAKGKNPGFRKALLEVFEKTGGAEALLNYLVQNLELDKNGKPTVKYDSDKDGIAKMLNTPRYENFLNMLVKTTPKTEMEDDGEDGNSYESRMSKVGKQLESNPSLKKEILDDLEDEA